MLKWIFLGESIIDYEEGEMKEKFRGHDFDKKKKEWASGAAANRQIFNRYIPEDSTWQVQLLYFLFLEIQLLNIFQSEFFFFENSFKKITGKHWEKFIFINFANKSTLEMFNMVFGSAMKLFMMLFLRWYLDNINRLTHKIFYDR